MRSRNWRQHLHSQLSKAQKEAVMHKDGPMMVLAGPGSGKTLVITKRIQYLISHYQIPPQRILVITFTRAAANEMKERFWRLAGDGQYEEISQDQVKLYLKREFVHMINVDTVFVSLFAMEKRMLAKDAMVLHCSVLKVKSGVILFSGPSGIGKSTQAGLWMKYRKARVINGDRTLLKKENGRWMSLGWPICGSSEICYNEAYPVKAVIFLGQAEENDGRRLRYFDAIKAMISQITVNGWNPQFVEKIWNLTEDFAAQIPVFEYGCNMEEAAVDTLENLLLDILE